MSQIHRCVKDKVQPHQRWSLSPAGWSFLTSVLLLKALRHLCPHLAYKLPLPAHTLRGSKITGRCLNPPTLLPASLSSQLSEPPKLQQLFRFSSWAKTQKESNCSTLPPVKPHVLYTHPNYGQRSLHSQNPPSCMQKLILMEQRASYLISILLILH